MARETKPQTNFTGGEWSPRADARIDISKYNNSADIIENFLINQVGGAFFRPGTYFTKKAKTSAAGKVCLLNFIYNTAQAYVIEAGNLYFRFYANNGQLINAGNPVELTTPYAIADVFTLRSAQNADTKYLVSTLGTYKPQKLTRLSSILFAINPQQFIGGPFMTLNVSATTLTPSSDTGATTLTATIPAWGAATQYTQGAFVTNGGNTYVCIFPNTSSGAFAGDLAAGYWQLGAVFHSTHVGSLWKVKSGTVVITGFTNATVVTGYVQNNVDGSAGSLATGPAAVTTWAEGSFSDFRGWPTCCIFYEQRLYYGKGNTFYGSVIGAFDNFAAGSVTATDAVSYQLLEDLVNSIGWMQGSTFALKAGTSDGDFTITSGTQNLPINPSNVLAQRQTVWGSAAIDPVRIGGVIYYASQDLNQIRELQYYFDITADRSIDMTLLADHIFVDGGGIVQINRQIFPMPRLWVPRVDGQVAVLTRNIEQEVQGWSRMVMGSTKFGPGVVESLTVIPTPSGPSQVWVSVNRNINGVVTRCIEYFTGETFTYDWDPVRMDCASTYNVPVTISGVTNANPCVVTANAHGFANGDQIKIDNIVGTTQLNGNFYVVENAAANTFSLDNLDGSEVDSTAFGLYLSGGQVRKMVTVISGLDYLNGENVVVTCDGGIPGKQQIYAVSGGLITLQQKSAVVNVGLPYTGKIKLHKFSGTAQGKMTRIYLATVRVVRSLGLKVGTDVNKLGQYQFANVNDPLGHPPALVNKDLEVRWQSTWSKEDQLYIVQDQPLPLFICGGFFRAESEELD